MPPLSVVAPSPTQNTVAVTPRGSGEEEAGAATGRVVVGDGCLVAVVVGDGRVVAVVVGDGRVVAVDVVVAIVVGVLEPEVAVDGSMGGVDGLAGAARTAACRS
jgi:hypothetical protein